MPILIFSPFANFGNQSLCILLEFCSIVGLWDVIAMEAPNINAAQTTGFSKVFVSGEKMTFSGGPNNRMQTQDISIHRCVATLLLFEGICGHWNGNFTLRGHLPSNQKSKSTVENQNKQFTIDI